MSRWTTYDEYGNATRLSSSTVGNMYRWHGADQRAVLAAGLILMGVRLYNPVTGHFTTRDPVPGGNSTMYAYPQDPLNSDDLDGLAARYGGLYILYIGRTPVYVGQSVNIRSRVLRHFRKPHFLRVTHVAVKSIPRHRGESYKSYKRRLSVAEHRVMNNLRARGYKLPFNSINAHWRGRTLGNGTLRGLRIAPKSQIQARPSGAGGLGGISFGPLPAIRGGGAALPFSKR